MRSNHLNYRPVDYSIEQFVWILKRFINYNSILYKGGDPAAGSPTATLLRLHPSHEPYRGKRPPCG